MIRSTSPNEVRLSGRRASRRLSLQSRIQRRLDVLVEWQRKGIPPGKMAPRSLRGARDWNDPELDIVPIPSPNDFTTTHNIYGDLVKDIAGLLTSLRRKTEIIGSRKRIENIQNTPEFERDVFVKQLQAAVSQWNSERDQRLHEKKRADAAEARSMLLLQENRNKDELIADLRRQLSRPKGLKLVD